MGNRSWPKLGCALAVTLLIAGCRFAPQLDAEYLSCKGSGVCPTGCTCLAKRICVPDDPELPPASCCDDGDRCTLDQVVGDKCKHEALDCTPCEAARPLTPSVGTLQDALPGGTGSIDPQALACPGPAPGPERLHSVEIPTEHRLVASLDMAQGDEILYLLDGCPEEDGTCAAWSDASSWMPERVEFSNYGPTRTWYLVVDAKGLPPTGSDYTLTWSVLPHPTGNGCDSEPALLEGAGSTIQGDLAASDDNLDPIGLTGCADAAAGPDRVFEVAVPADHHLRARLDTASGDEVLYLLGACPADQNGCLAWADGSTWMPERLEWSNYDQPATAYLVVDLADGSAPGGPFTLDWLLLPHGTGNDCAAPQAVLSGIGGVDNANLAAHDDNLDPLGLPNCPGGASGPDKAYRIQIPTGHHFRATLDTASGDELLYLWSACPADQAGCLAWADGSTWMPERLEFSNYGADAEFVLVADLRDWSAPGAEISLDWTLLPHGAGNSCQDEPDELLGPSGTVTSTLAAHDDNLDPAGQGGCPAASGPDRIYKITLPKGHHLRASLDTASGDELIYLLPDCPPAIDGCTAWADASTWMPERLEFSNYLEQATFYLVVDLRDWSAPGGQYTLTFSNLAHPPGNECASAELLVVETGTITGTFAELDDNQDPTALPGCPAGAGPDRSFAFAVPAGHTLQATLDTATGDEVLYLLGGCGTADACLASADASTWMPETLIWTNEDGIEPVYLVIDLRDGSAAATEYTLSWSITPG